MTLPIFVNSRFKNHPPGGVRRAATEVVHRLEGRVSEIGAPEWARGGVGHIWEQVILPRSRPTDGVLWSPANTGPLMDLPHVITLHDLAVFDHPDGLPTAFRLWYRFLLPRLVQRAALILTPSEFSRRRICRRFDLSSARVRVIPNGVGAPFSAVAERVEREIPLPERYVLVVGSWPARKNLSAAVAAWQIARRDYPDLELVIVGRADVQLGDGPIPYRLANLTDVQLADVYRRATALIYLSGYEGFGLPILEAMACGTPVVTVASGALSETGGDACLYAEQEQAGEVVRELLRDDDLRQDIIARGQIRAAEFTWDKSAQLTLSALQSVADRR